MNYLAHFYLSYEDPELLVGNFLGDFVRKSEMDALPKRVQKGVLIHREIDRFMDSHEIVKQSKEKLKRHGHYGSVIVDVLYDHFLAEKWNDYHSVELKTYAEGCYSVLRDYEHLFNQKAAMLFYYMQKRNWIQYYPSVEGISRILYSMSKRTPYETTMGTAGEDLEQYYTEFEKEFLEYFPLVEEYGKKVLSEKDRA